MTAVRVRGDAARSAGFHLGDGLFETVLVSGGRPCLLRDHLVRMRRSGRALGIAIPPDLDAFIASEIGAMGEEEGRPARAALRISVARGEWHGLDADPAGPPDVVLALRRLPDRPPESVRAAIVPHLDERPESRLAGHKVLSWMHMVRARREARAQGADVAILLGREAAISEADCANVFVVSGGRVRTPPATGGVLPGITRRRVLRALRAAGRDVAEEGIDLVALVRADEVFLTSSLFGVVPVARVGDRRIGCGPVAAWLREAVPAEGAGPRRRAR